MSTHSMLGRLGCSLLLGMASCDDKEQSQVGVNVESDTELLEREPRTEEEMRSSLWIMP